MMYKTDKKIKFSFTLLCLLCFSFSGNASSQGTKKPETTTGYITIDAKKCLESKELGKKNVRVFKLIGMDSFLLQNCSTNTDWIDASKEKKVKVVDAVEVRQHLPWVAKYAFKKCFYWVEGYGQFGSKEPLQAGDKVICETNDLEACVCRKAS